ncbi:MAG TPA: hypothetical protein VF514_13130, partial [Bacteroidota bacterium]
NAFPMTDAHCGETARISFHKSLPVDHIQAPNVQILFRERESGSDERDLLISQWCAAPAFQAAACPFTGLKIATEG